MTTCSRSGCTKKLNANNTKGHCGSGCRSPDAPVYQRAKDVGETKPAKVTAKAEVSVDALARFRLVTEALGVDSDKLLAEYAQQWLDAAAQQLTVDEE